MARRLGGLMIAVVATAGHGCADAPPSDAAQIAVALPNGWEIVEVSYVVLSAQGIALLAGSEDVSAPGATLSVQLSLPTGRGYVLQLSATNSDGVTCNGTSAPFDVVLGQPTLVKLALVCGGASPGLDGCPTVDVQSASPAATAPSGTIALTATASDPDPGDVPTYAWTATAGSFADPLSASTLYTCTVPGAQTIVLAVDDGHRPSGCTVTYLLPVSCLAPAAP